MRTSSSRRCYLADDEQAVRARATGYFSATDSQTGGKVALKKLSFYNAEGVPSAALKEISLLKSLDHANIVRLLDVDYNPSSSSASGSHSLFQVFEWLPGGNLGQRMRSRGKMEAGDARQVCVQVLRALHYCHERGVAHRHLSPDMILFTDTASVSVKITGFNEGTTGGVHYAAPEQLVDDAPDSLPPTAADMWAVGVCVAEMLFGEGALWPVPGLGAATSRAAQLLAIFQTLGSPELAGEGWEQEAENVDASAVTLQRPEFKGFPVRTVDSVLNTQQQQPLAAAAEDLMLVVRGVLMYNPAARLTAHDALLLALAASVQ